MTRTHGAYNLATGEILTTNKANALKRWVKKHTIRDNKWLREHGMPTLGQWVFVHGANWGDCCAKLTVKLKRMGEWS